MRQAALYSICLMFLFADAPAQGQFGRFQKAPPPVNLPVSSQPTTGTGSIEGSVINDLTREPVKKASVMLNGIVSLTAVTDASGHFAFKQLPAGQYSLQANASNFPQPRSRLGGTLQRQINLTADEQKSGITLSLIPGASIRGRVTDDEGSPMPNCNARAMQFTYHQGVQKLTGLGAANTDDRGEYRITDLSAGKYFVLVRCQREIPLPHAFVPRGPGLDLPTQAYAPEFYPGTTELPGAVRVTAAAGTDVSGIDFRMLPAAGVIVRGHVTAADTESAPGNVQIMLEPQDPNRREWLQFGARFDRRSRSFQFRNVPPGAYEIVAIARGEGSPREARVSIAVGSTPPEPLELALAAAPGMSGELRIDADEKPALENIRVMLNPVDRQLYGPQPNAQVQKDGSFTFPGVPPGHWRVFVNGAPGFVKTATVNEQEVSPYSLNVAGGAPATLKVVMSTKWAQMEGSALDVPNEGAQVWGMLWPVEDDRQQAGLERNFNLDNRGSFRLVNIAPGHYHACVVGVSEPWVLLQNPALLKVMASRCPAIDVPEGGHVSPQIPFIPADDLARLEDSLEN
jgi:hypothetical protein